MDETTPSAVTGRIRVWLKANGKLAVLAIVAVSIAATAIWGDRIGADRSYAILMLGLIGWAVASKLK